MHCGVDEKVPDADDALIPIGIDAVRICDLIGDDLVHLSSLELNLLFVELVFLHVLANADAGAFSFACELISALLVILFSLIFSEALAVILFI